MIFRVDQIDIVFLEPGYYEKEQFGIRIEDIVQIVPAQVANDFNGRGALTFKTVTMCPIHTKLINKSLLTEKDVSILPKSKCLITLNKYN